MTELTLTRIGLKAGRYEAMLDGAGPVPVIEFVHLDRVIATAEVSEAGDGRHRLAATLPAALISDGVQVVTLRSAADGTVLDRLTILAGTGLEDDFRAELALLRDEVEVLKRAVRRLAGD
ncbi:hypothetical protein HKCCE2091_12870 [Rhodobacterales bacterium HKCCE2091]|nr:hypothetical protein [Rhodobacterales bacterium HKCCE2091]